MSNCGCEGSCPVCRLGEVDNHKCNRCGAEFCSKCHGIKNNIKSKNVLPCKCDRMKCRDRKCRKGEIDKKKPVSLRTGCGPCSVSVAYPCNVCGRLHWDDGSPVRNRPGHRAFLKKGRIFHIDRKGKGYYI